MFFIKEHLWMSASDEASLKKNFSCKLTLIKVGLENKMLPQLWMLWWLSNFWTTAKHVTDKYFEP